MTTPPRTDPLTGDAQNTAKQRIAFVTGSAGFIGYHLALRFLQGGFKVIGLDGMTDYYDVALKRKRHAMLCDYDGFTPVEGLLETDGLMMDLMAQHRPDIVVNLAAQAGVRWSIENPRAYLDANMIGVFNLLEAVRAHPVDHLLMASTSSVFGANTRMPYAEVDKADHQMSFYAATKKAGEAMSHSYAHLYGIPTTNFRFFTVYGPWGRPDMALFKFTRAMIAGEPIDVYNNGDMQRDFTYIDDLVEGIVLLADKPPVAGPAVDSLSPVAPWRVVNIGNGAPVKLMDYIEAIENALDMKARKNMMPMQAGDVPGTWADNTLLRELTGYQPKTDVQTGVARFVDWYRGYYDT